uniref:Uncharacterized protein n=1 Tax=Anguilla anguilla TaxID=7936 RepID=A0A0E9TPU7_ANGAN
MFSPWPLCY